MGGYQYGDVPYMGPSVIVVADGDRGLGRKGGQAILGDMLWATAIRSCLKLPIPRPPCGRRWPRRSFPVALFDTGDNVGGGSSARQHVSSR